MPLEEASGCLALIGRACVAVLETIFDNLWVESSLRCFWECCQFVGRLVVLVVTLFQVWLKDEHDTLAGVIGAVTIVLFIAGAMKLATLPGSPHSRPTPAHAAP